MTQDAAPARTVWLEKLVAGVALSIAPLLSGAAEFGSPPLRCATLLHPATADATISESTYAMFAARNPAAEVDAFLSDACRLEERQAQSPRVMLRYTDPVSGALLKATLDPSRMRAITALAQEALRRGGEPNRVLSALDIFAPLFSGYVGAFDSNPAAFEAEVLDSLESQAVLMRANFATIRDTYARYGDAHPGERDITTKNLESARRMFAVQMSAESAIVREIIKVGKLSPAGAQRAGKIAQVFVSAD